VGRSGKRPTTLIVKHSQSLAQQIKIDLTTLNHKESEAVFAEETEL
jgi:hypothetical protein